MSEPPSPRPGPSRAQAEPSTQPASRPTMRDVAALAGVGLKTVSRVVNGVPSVAPELAARVHTAADKLGYRPNLTASHLRRSDGRTATIGLLLEDVGNPFSAALHRAVEDVAMQRGVFVLAGSLDEDPVRERTLVSTLIDRRVDGLIIVPAGTDHSYLIQEQRAGTAVVFLDRQPTLLGADAVVSDNRDGARRAVSHLIAAGHRRIAYLGDKTSISTASDRFGGYLEALRSAGLDAESAVVRHELRDVEIAERAVTELVRGRQPPTAVFASQNLVTIGAARALAHLAMADRTALMGFDDFLLADSLRPAVSVMAQDPAAMGRLAAQLLFRRIDGDDSPGRTYVIPTRLVARGSGEIPPPA
jgi:LacI family transcriptional regulator